MSARARMEAATPLDATQRNIDIYAADPRPHPDDYAPEEYDSVLNIWHARQEWNFTHFQDYGVHLYRTQDWIFRFLFHGLFGGAEEWERAETDNIMRDYGTWLDEQIVLSPYAEDPEALEDYRSLRRQLTDVVHGADKTIRDAAFFFALGHFPPLFRIFMNTDESKGVVMTLVNRATFLHWWKNFVQPAACDLMHGTMSLIDFVNLLRRTYVEINGVFDFHDVPSFSDLDMYKELALSAKCRRFVDVSFSQQEFVVNAQRDKERRQEVMQADAANARSKQTYDARRDVAFERKRAFRDEVEAMCGGGEWGADDSL